MKFSIISLSIALFSTSVQAMDVLIAYEGNDDHWPKVCVEKVLKRTQPFDKLPLNFKYASMPKGFAKCEKNTFSRAMGCNLDIGPYLTETQKADKVIYFTSLDSRKNNASDFASYSHKIAFLSLNDSPCANIVHEFMHLFNFADEYRFEDIDKPKLKCQENITSYNMFTISAFNQEFSSDQEARDALKNSGIWQKIPWHKDIEDTTPITYRSEKEDGTTIYKIGTPTNIAPKTIALFRGNCANRFKPTTQYNVMVNSRMQEGLEKLIPDFYQKYLRKEFPKENQLPIEEESSYSDDSETNFIPAS